MNKLIAAALTLALLTGVATVSPVVAAGSGTESASGKSVNKAGSGTDAA